MYCEICLRQQSHHMTAEYPNPYLTKGELCFIYLANLVIYRLYKISIDIMWEIK